MDAVSRFSIAFAILASAAMLAGARAEPADDSLRIYAVHIVQHPPQSWTGYGIYLGNGLVITAAHVVGSAARTKPDVRIAGLELPTETIKEGSFEKEDLTLLRIDQSKLPISLQMRRMPLCRKSLSVGESVIVAIPEGTVRSRIISPLKIPPDLRARFSTAIEDVATTGNSGSGVFDAAKKCLLGIMSRKFFNRDEAGHEHDIAKYFVPAGVIADFMPARYRF
jgi:S1-C subfamily serine protease